jgi:LysR family transcriptional regulator, benzoate and cis,cis-muconate-responsive activator of ben and cat genes
MEYVSSIELRHLRYFLAVARELHFGRAARRLGMAQPPLSQQIAALERLLGATLFDRDNKRVQLTAAGEAVVEEAERILALSARLPAVVAAAKSGQSGVLSIGFSASASLGLVPPLFREFRQRFPSVQLILREGPIEDRLSDVEAGVLDVAVIRGPIVRPTLRVETLWREQLLLALPTDHALKAKRAIAWSDLAAYDFVLFPRTAAPALYDAIIAQCSLAGFSPHVAHEATEWSTVSALIAAGAGLGFGPESVSRFYVEGITFRSVEGAVVSSEIVAATRPDNTSPALRAFVEIATQLS